MSEEKLLDKVNSLRVKSFNELSLPSMLFGIDLEGGIQATFAFLSSTWSAILKLLCGTHSVNPDPHS